MRSGSSGLLGLLTAFTTLDQQQQVAGLQGSLDACREDVVPWTAVRTAILEYSQGGRVLQEDIDRVRSIALEGGLDPQNCDCWYGWITLRFFIPQVLSSEQRAHVLEEQLFHTEFLLWLGSPWNEMLDSHWQALDVVASTSQLVRTELSSSDDKAGCSEADLRLLEAVQAEDVASAAWSGSARVAHLAAAVLLRLPEDVLLAQTQWHEAWPEPCPALAASTAALLLGLAPMGFRVTPGYAFRLVQETLKLTSAFGLLAFLRSPWPVAELLPKLAARLREVRDRTSDLAEDKLAEQVVEASRQAFPGLPPSFLPPMTTTEKLRLFQGLAATHAALTAAQVPYFAITGTLLGAMRHHSFVPWDGDADVCADIRDEIRLLFLALLQGDGSNEADSAEWPAGAELHSGALLRAAAALSAAGFELWANAERPLTFKLSSRAWQRVPGKSYGYPYVDVWFCHGWASGDFSLQSASFGVPLPREVVFPRRKLFFAGLPLWSFGDPRESILQYYGGSNAFTMCVGHMTFHRQERKFSEDNERDRYDSRMECRDLAHSFAFTGASEPGPPEGIESSAMLAAVSAWLLLQPSAQWSLDPDGPVAEHEETAGESRDEVFRRARAEGMQPLQIQSQSLGRVRAAKDFQAVNTTKLFGPGSILIHHLVEASLPLEQPRGASCDLLLRLRPLTEEVSSGTQLLGSFASPIPAVSLGEQLLEASDGSSLRLDVPSCVCRYRLGGLALQWVAEDPP